MCQESASWKRERKKIVFKIFKLRTLNVQSSGGGGLSEALRNTSDSYKINSTFESSMLIHIHEYTSLPYSDILHWNYDKILTYCVKLVGKSFWKLIVDKFINGINMVRKCDFLQKNFSRE